MQGKYRALAVTAVSALALAGAAFGATKAVVVGTPGNDTLWGTAGADIMYGKGGDDAVHGRAGNDSIWGGLGSDIEYGGPGDDALHSLADDNAVDILDCGAGSDTAYVNSRKYAAHLIRVRDCEKIVLVSPDAPDVTQDN